MAPRGDDLTQDSILRNAYVGAWLVGVIRWPHLVWGAPISCALLGLAANYRIARASSRGQTVLLGVGVLALLAGAAALAKVALDIAR